jgi:hypothetical protein
VEAIAISSEQAAIVTRLDAASQISLAKMLAGLAEARQALVSEETLRLYRVKLAQFDLEDVKEVIGKMAIRSLSRKTLQLVSVLPVLFLI